MEASDPTPLSALAPTLARLRGAWDARRPELAQRRADLRRLDAVFSARIEAMDAAIRADFGHRSTHENLVSEALIVRAEIAHALRHLRRWAKPRRVGVGWRFWPARAEVRPMPVGVVGIIAPWNYPVNLALVPLVSAIAAGNHVYLKPSEHTPRTSAWLHGLLADVFPDDRVAVALGGADVGAAFSALPFDHLLFTGSAAIGRKVLAAAAPNLTPVTLELGGKSPAIVAPGYPIAHAVQRILAGKLLNAGQTCIAPDYVMVPEGSLQAFAEKIRAQMRRMFGADPGNKDYTSVISDRHYARLEALVADAAQRGAKILQPAKPGDPNWKAHRKFPPTLVVGATDQMAVMQEEIFGPVLPVLGYRDKAEPIAFINRHERPLALYWFGKDRAARDEVLARTVSGGVTVNDCLFHFTQINQPMGGVGASGTGAYHGEWGFKTFSKLKPVFYRSKLNRLADLYPPYGAKIARLEKMLRFMS
jgi:coniferyl-aldehyde dehydrogenase